MDHLCGAMIFTFRLQGHGTLHDITLPKSWLMRLLPHAEILRTKGKELSFIYKKHIGGLLEQIYSGVGAGESYSICEAYNEIDRQV